MTTTATTRTRPERAPRHVTAAGFHVALHEGHARSARAVPGDGRLCVVVADAGGSAGSPVAMDLPVSLVTSSTLVWCHRDGSVQVRASWAPPALLVRPGRTMMVPETPGLPGTALLEPGDRLLVLSSSAFEAALESVVRLLHAPPGRLLAADPVELLHDLLGDARGAGGAVVTRLPAG